MIVVRDSETNEDFILINKEQFKKFLDAMEETCSDAAENIKTGYMPNIDICERKKKLMSAEMEVAAILQGCNYIKRIYY